MSQIQGWQSLKLASPTRDSQNDRHAHDRRDRDYADGDEWRSPLGFGADVGDAVRFCGIDSGRGIQSQWQSSRQ